MKAVRRITAIVVTASVLMMSGCAAYQSEVVEGSTVSVGWGSSFFSYNAATSYGNNPANANVVYATNSSFNYYDDVPELVTDPSFGSYTKLSDDPLVVRYTIADGVVWSDGVAVDAADLLLNWAALSGTYNDPAFDPTEFIDSATGQLMPNAPDDVVYFDSGADVASPTGLGLVSTIPEVSDDRKSIVLHYDRPYVDWELAFTSAGVPAHVVARHALGLDDPQAAKDAILAAITTHDETALAAISAFWNNGFNLDGMPESDLLVGNGPYVVTDFVPDQYVTLSANPRYEGERMPRIEQILIRTMVDPLAAVQAMTNGSVQVIAPQATVAAVEALATLDVAVTSSSGTYEHLDLQFDHSKSGHFANPLIREAFLKTVPRAAIVDELVVPVQADAVPRNSNVFIPGTAAYDAAVVDNGSETFAEVDIEGARALLAEAGVSDPEVCVLYASSNPRRAREFALIQESAGHAGFRVTDCSSADWRELLGVEGAYDAALYGWQHDDLGVSAAIAAFTTDGRNNFSSYASERVDRLLFGLDVGAAREQQEQVLREVDAELFADSFGLPLYQFPELFAFDSAAVQGISPSPVGAGLFWNVWAWSQSD